MDETAKKKTDLKLFGEIEKRVTQLQAPGKALLLAAIEDGVPESEVEIIRQVVERRAELTASGKAYVDTALGVEPQS
jgi:hypothetical protein